MAKNNNLFLGGILLGILGGVIGSVWANYFFNLLEENYPTLQLPVFIITTVAVIFLFIKLFIILKIKKLK